MRVAWVILVGFSKTRTVRLACSTAAPVVVARTRRPAAIRGNIMSFSDIFFCHGESAIRDVLVAQRTLTQEPARWLRGFF